jgi:TRAP-type transport system periplasmic protein
VALMRENGMEVITEIDRAPFQELAAEAAWPVYTDRFGSEMIERILAVQ